MDFCPQAAACPAGGRFQSLDPALLPPLWLLRAAGPGGTGKDSGQVHSGARARWAAHEPGIRCGAEGGSSMQGAPHAHTHRACVCRQGMQELAALAFEGREALQAGDAHRLAGLMRRNFELRRTVLGDAVVGAANLATVAVAHSVGAAAKLPGSGGAVVALCPDGAEQADALAAACAQAGLLCERVEVGPVLHWAAGGDGGR